MPEARESLLEAAAAALTARPWPAVRMVEVAAAAGVSRQTLYNARRRRRVRRAPRGPARPGLRHVPGRT
ncbi:TetR family transcriptional regulator, partial [Streptomyces xanthophaeus]|uniref:TetR family transcriptional regulator n=1 Tax=Streptomyces xanthophaeus TaxID=67385 RepID=UPI00365A00F9